MHAWPALPPESMLSRDVISLVSMIKKLEKLGRRAGHFVMFPHQTHAPNRWELFVKNFFLEIKDACPSKVGFLFSKALLSKESAYNTHSSEGSL